MTLYILSSKGNEKKLINELKQECKKINRSFREIESNSILFDFNQGKIFIKNKEILVQKNDYFFARGMGINKFATGILVLFLKSLKIKNSFNHFSTIPPITSKYFQAWYFFEYKIDSPQALVGSEQAILENYSIIRKNLGKEFILKGNGSKGDFVFLIKNKIELQKIITQMPIKRKKMLTVQEKIKADFDIRLLFFKNKFIAGIKRSSDNFLNNYNKGGKVEKYIPNQQELKLAQKAIKKFGMEYIAVDLMFKNGKPLVLEIQIGPWTDGLRLVNNNINLGKQIISLLK